MPMSRRLLLHLPSVAALQGQARLRPRARDLGIRPGIFPPGPLNAITDVAGVRVGHKTLIEGESIRTGVTVMLPHSGNLFQDKIAAGFHAGNAFGKFAGSTQIEELGVIETPIALTNTLSVWRVAEALVEYTLRQAGNERVWSVNPVVGETNDARLNDIRRMAVEKSHLFDAIRAASGGPVEEGTVGAGTGTEAFGFKGGIGTSSRKLPAPLGGWTIGALVQSNYGGVLTMDGTPMGRELGRYLFQGETGDGSVIVLVATDAPVDSRQLTRLARRGMLGLARTGTPSTHGSGDYVLAFSTSPKVRSRHGALGVASYERLTDDSLTPLFEAVVEATEEAVYNSLLRATAVTGFNGARADAIPVEQVRAVLQKYGRGQP